MHLGEHPLCNIANYCKRFMNIFENIWIHMRALQQVKKQTHMYSIKL